MAGTRPNLTLLCDADGTLLQSWDWIMKALDHTLDYFCITVPKNLVVSHFLGGTSLREFYERYISHIDTDVCVRVHQEYQAGHMDLITLFPGVYETLQELHGAGVKLGIVTSRKTKAPLIKTLRQFDIDVFDVIVTLEDVVSPKPDPAGIVFAMEKFEARMDQTFFVGDTAIDIRAGQRAGVATVGALYGFCGEALREAEADYYIESFSEVLDIVLSQ